MTLRLRSLGALTLLAACASTAPSPQPRPSMTAAPIASASVSPPPAASSAVVESPPAPSGPPTPADTYGKDSPEHAVFTSWVEAHKDMTFEQVMAAIGPLRPDPAAPSFDPSTALYYDKTVQALQLNAAEIALLRKRGFASVDHGQRYSMGSMYHAIYTRDLPVLITTDSILHAMHRSFDGVLAELEGSLFKGALDDVLASTHKALAAQAGRKKGSSAATTALRDADLYLTVARNLIAGLVQDNAAFNGVTIHSEMQQDAEALVILRAIAAQQMQTVQLYGREHAIDFSQFRVRGHYTRSPELGMYFKAMMWMGRPDTGFGLRAPPPGSQLQLDPDRERLAAAALALLLRESGKASVLDAVRTYVDFLVGEADDLSARDLLGVLDRSGIRTVDALGNEATRKQLAAALERPPRPAGQILGQAAYTSEAPSIMQLFGQSFLLDSFVLGHVVFNTIGFKGSTPERMMPSGLDVAAALGSNEAVALLEGELRTYSYGSNLLAARAVADSYPAARWQKSVYNRWLDAMRVIDDVPANQGRFPDVMTTRAWQRKQLQTQLASWAELRHDTILYAKQSYTALTCEYPAGYVEPYPLFFTRVAEVAREQARLARLPELQKLAGDARQPPAAQPPQRPPRVAPGAAVPPGAPRVPSAPAPKMQTRLEAIASFFDAFAATMKKLQALADKELAGQPFTEEEKKFLKQTIDIRGAGSGPPRYDGWYTTLIYGGEPAAWMPTVADVHTDPNSGRALEVAVGDASFLVVAVNNDREKMVFVGPAYSYYEFTAPSSARLRDEEWQHQLMQGPAPAPPAWTSWFKSPVAQRRLDPAYAAPGLPGGVPPGRRPPVAKPPRGPVP
ncbi:MAG: DUF3160 domain-containing protein [Deltaproteobacteria bacterium]|nr:DUF3160 domain-containing protein [Deltaproteobacteria bacterium]